MASVSGLGAFFIVIIALVVFGLAAWIIYTHLRARRLGLPQPTLASYIPFSGAREPRYGAPQPAAGGIVGWFNGQMRKFRNRNNRSAGGAYEEPLGGVGGGRGRANNRGFGPLDPDEAWDARVGTEADGYGVPGGYNEEQELGLHGEHRDGFTPTPMGAPPGYGADRGRSLSREPEPYIGGSQAGLDRRYDEEMGRKPATNPFDDAAALPGGSLRGVSPRPIETSSKGHTKGQDSADSPTERRSMFREDV